MMSATDFATRLVPAWVDIARDRKFGGIVQRLDIEGRPIEGEYKSALAHARTIFSLSHLYLHTNNAALLEAARVINDFMTKHFRLPHGGYRFAVRCDGSISDDPADNVCRAYDQSFALLALVTLQKADPGAVTVSEIENLWAFIETITEQTTGALYEDEVMARRGPQPGDQRAQNPQMHMLEALLHAHELTGQPVWLDRADRYIVLMKEYFIDAGTGAVREFVSYDLSPLDTPAGRRREPGHQYEWAWLLLRYRELGGQVEVSALADTMAAFANHHGIRHDGGLLDGAVFDAVDADGGIVEASHLLWPLTEAGKLACLLHIEGVEGACDRARDIETLIFSRFFVSDRVSWANQLDGSGAILWPDALSRMIYHVLLFVTEGARAGLWKLHHTNTH